VLDLVKRVGPSLTLLLACVLAGLLGASALADTTPPATTETATTTTAAVTTTTPATVASGVVLGSVPIGGLPADAAVQAVLQRFSRPVVLRLGKTTITVTPDVLGASVPADGAVAKALTVPPNTTLGLHASADATKVAAFVSKLAARFDRRPVASRLLLRRFRPFVTPSTPGRVVEQPAAARVLTAELMDGSRAPIDLPAKILPPPVTERTIGPVIVIKRASNLLTLYDGARTVRRFHVATGQTIYPTPLGRFQIVVKWKNPWWYPPASPWAQGDKPVPPGPNNPLGTRWMGLSAPGVGIHGTPEPASIGYSLSHGCIRMLIPQAEWLFDHVTVGTPVFIVPV
jgi:lipoprotein-anchoring transpeptidase ErfK/SrfK